MPRRPRRGTAGLVFHVMNRGARRLTLFNETRDYETFLDVLRQATERFDMRLLSYVAMPNHWHLVLWPARDEQLSGFMAWMTATHVRRWHLGHGSVGTGTLYQGRYKAVAVSDDASLFTVCRYVERNPVRAGLVARARDWKWSSAWDMAHGKAPWLSAWPVDRPAQWDALVDSELPAAELRDLRRAIRRSRPFGSVEWRRETTQRLKWDTGLRPRGRPHRDDRKN